MTDTTSEKTLNVDEKATLVSPYSGRYYPLSSYYDGGRELRFEEEYPVLVRKINKTTAHVSFIVDDEPDTARYPVPIESLVPLGVKVRRLGEVPEGGLSPLDPRLDWLWKDADRLAKMRNHCREYRDMCDVLGLPGPVKDFKITRSVSGLDVTFTVKARSKDEAEKVADQTLAEKGLA